MPIRVLHVFGGGVRSGIDTHILTLAKGLKGADVELVLAPLNNGPICTEARLYVSEIIESDKKFRGDLGFVRRLANRIKKANADIVHTHSYDGNFYGARAARLAGTKYIVNTVHTFEADAMIDIYKSRIIRKIVARQNRALMRSASHLIAVCGSLEERLVQEGFDKKKIAVISNGLDPGNFLLSSPDKVSARRALGLKDGEFVVGSMGRIARVKNFDVLLKAARKVIDRGSQAKFIIIGDGPLRGKMESLALELGLEKNVIFVGWQADTSKILSAIDLFVLCSKTETTSYALLEAMALAKPTIATTVGGNTDLVKAGETGLLIPPGDVEATADAVTDLIMDKEKCERFGAAGRQRVDREFSAGTMANRTLEVYRRLVGKSAI